MRYFFLTEKTTITTPPSDQSVTKGQTATFPIGIHVDPEEKQHLKVKWFKDDQEIVMGPKYSMGDDHSLIIHDSAVADTGNYKCKVDTELDSIEASAKLVVKGKTKEIPWNVYKIIFLYFKITSIDFAGHNFILFLIK